MQIFSLWFQSTQELPFTAGQYTQLYLPRSQADARSLQRYFTISSAPKNELFSITTRYIPSRASSFKQALFQLTPNTIVQVSQPMGDFVLPKDRTIPLLFIAVGLGITPYMSIAGWLTTTGESRNIILIRQVWTEDDLLQTAYFDKAGFIVHTIVGPIRVADILDHTSITPRTLIYIAGPEGLVSQLASQLRQVGFQPNRIIMDAFLGYADI